MHSKPAVKGGTDGGGGVGSYHTMRASQGGDGSHVEDLTTNPKHTHTHITNTTWVLPKATVLFPA